MQTRPICVKLKDKPVALGVVMTSGEAVEDYVCNGRHGGSDGVGVADNAFGALRSILISMRVESGVGVRDRAGSCGMKDAGTTEARRQERMGRDNHSGNNTHRHSANSGDCLPETELHHAWQTADSSRAQVESSDGTRYRVLYSGMPGGSYGPDFRQAVLEREDGSELVGDVEIHIRSKEWYAHGHSTDDRYNGVKIHGVWSARDGGGCVQNRAGLSIPQVGLSTLHSDTRAPRGNGHTAPQADGALAQRIVSQAGDEWFATKVAMFTEEIDTFGGDIAAQLGIFEALGYSRNRWHFRTLGRRLPWPYLKRELLANSDHERTADQVAERLLRWAAGWQPAPNFAAAPALMGDAPEWNRAYGMPANSPEKRVAAAAHLTASWFAAGGPLAHTLDAVRGAARCSDVWRELAPKASGIGRSRAMEVTVNVVLPLVAAWAQRGGDNALYSKAIELYKAHPKMSANSVLREAMLYLRSRGIASGKCPGARQQQGAMHLYNSYLVRPRATRQPGLPLPATGQLRD